MNLFDLQEKLYKLIKKHGGRTEIITMDEKEIDVTTMFHEDLKKITLNFHYKKDINKIIDNMKA